MRGTIRKRRNPTIPERVGGYAIGAFLVLLLARHGASSSSAAPAPSAPDVAPWRADATAPAPRWTPWPVELGGDSAGVPAVDGLDCDSIEDLGAVEDPDVLDYCAGER